MFLRGLLSLLCLVLGATAFILWDCTTSVVNVITTDPMGLCATVAGFGIADLDWIASGLAVVVILVLGIVWIPVARNARRAHNAQPERALLANLTRLSDGPVLVPIEEDGVDNFDLRRRVEVVEIAFASGAGGNKELTGEWLALLREANRRHNDGRLATAEFLSLNTRLIDVLSLDGEPAEARY